MTAQPPRIVLVVDDQQLGFDSVGDIVAHAQNLSETARRDWRNRGSQAEAAAALEQLAAQSDAIAALSAAGLRHIENEIAMVEASLAEIDRLVGEL
jgi:hypothetical protein